MKAATHNYKSQLIAIYVLVFSGILFLSVPIAPAQSVNSTPLALDFVHYVDSTFPLDYFRLNQSSGTSETSSDTYSDSRTGASVSTPGAPVTGSNVAYTKLDGSSGSVSTSLSGGINTAGSIMAWVNLAQLPSASGTTQYIAGESQSGNDLDLQFTNDNVLRFYTTNNNQNLSYTPDPVALTGQWHFVVATFDNSGPFRALYWDGVQVAFDTTTSLTNKTAAFAIGASPVFSGRNFNGGIEEVGIWNVALSVSQVQNMYWLSSTLPNGIINSSYPAVTLHATGGNGSYTFSATGLPSGITLSTAGQFGGTPTVTGSFSPVVTVHVTSQDQPVMQTFSLNVDQPVTVTTSSLPNGTALSPYTQTTLAASGGSGTPYYWSVASGSLPPGLGLAATTGVISGNPFYNDSGNYTFTVQALDNLGNTGTKQFTITINPPLIITTTTLPAGDQGALYNQMLNAGGGSGGYSWSVLSGVAGALSLSSAGVVSGTPSQNGDFILTVTVTDSLGDTTSQGVNLHINPALLFINPSLPNGTVGVPYNATLGANGGSGTYNFTVISGLLPAGLMLNASTGAVTGTPTAAMSSDYVSVHVSDTANGQNTTSFYITINPALTISTTSLSAAQQGTLYNAQLTAAGGSGTGYQFSLPDGGLPAGLSLNASGTISGTPTATGNFSPAFLVTDSIGATGSQALALSVSAAGTVITANLPANTAIINIDATKYGAAYFSGTNQIYWAGPFDAASGGALIEYTIQPGTYSFRVINPSDAQKTYPALTSPQLSNIFTAWTYNSPWITSYLVFDVAAAANSSLNQLFSGAELATGYPDATQAYAAAISAGVYNEIFPGARNATPVTTYTFTNAETLIFAVPDYGLSDNAGGVSVLITPGTPPSVQTSSLPSGTAYQSYTATLTATGGSGTYLWSATGLPPGLAISPAGVISGTPIVAGTYPVILMVTDSSTGAQGTATIPIVILPGAPPILITRSASQVAVAIGGSVSASFSASGGVPPYTFSASGLPSGVTLSTSGALSGSPSQAGNFAAAVTVTDSLSHSAATSISISVLGLSTGSLPNGTAGQVYTASISATGGNPPYSFSATGLPSGLSVGVAGAVAGTVNTAGNYSFAVKVTDSGGLAASGTVSVTFSAPQPLKISNAALAAGTVNLPYSQPLTASGGYPPYSWKVSAGSPPAGLSLNASGIVSGTPTSIGSFLFGVLVTDGAGATATGTATVTIQAAPLTITTQSLPAGMNGVPYPQFVFGAIGGVPPYSWSVTGNLPPGLSLAPNGILTGTPSGTGNFSFTVNVTDSVGATSKSKSAQIRDSARATGGTNYTLSVRPSSADLILSANSILFSLVAPAATTPPSQAFSVQSTQASQQLSYSVSTSPQAPWLVLTNGSTTPDTVQATLTPAALALSPGTYQTTLAVTCTSSACAGHVQNVAVSLSVTSGSPQLQVISDLLAFGESASAPQSMTQSIAIANSGGGSLGIASVTCEDSWCSVAGVPSNVQGGASASIPITVDPSQLGPGFFRTQVDITTSAGKGAVPVTVLISADSSMVLGPVGTQFNMLTGGAPGNANGSFLVSVSTSSTVNWTASLPGNVPWITLGTPAGMSSATQPGTVTYSINSTAAQLAPGSYYGLIQVDATGVVNTPQVFEVVLSVLPANTPVIPDPEPGGLVFITQAGVTPPPQTITIYSASPSPSGFQASTITNDGGKWLAVSPGIGSASTGTPGTTTVTVDPTSLKPGVYRGGVSYSLSATAVRVVNITAIVTPPGTVSAGSASSGRLSPRVPGCTPTVLAPTQTGLVNNFAAPVAWPTPLAIVLADDCGQLITNAQIVATFSNGDPPLALTLVNPKQALYSATWTPRQTAPQMTIAAHTSASGYPAVTTQLIGAALPNAAPVLTPHGTLHSFYPLVGGALAPGTIIQIYGQNLASGTGQPTMIPLPPSLNGTSVIVGGIPAPLYYVSPGQINAQLPFELDPSKQYQVLVSANGALTTPEPIQLSPASPGMAAFSDGTLIAQHADGSLVTAASPAKSGEYLVAYLAGMGSTNAVPPTGAASPVNPLARPITTPSLTINGAQVPILFAGLTPGLVGLYQMNFQVPAGLPAGDITIVVTQETQASNQTVLPYQP